MTHRDQWTVPIPLGWSSVDTRLFTSSMSNNSDTSDQFLKLFVHVVPNMTILFLIVGVSCEIKVLFGD